jgi:hypothetical protein
MRYPAAGLGAAAATGGCIDVKRSIVLRSIKNQGRVRLDDNQTRISRARRADVTGMGAWSPHVEELALPKSLKSCNFTLAKAVIRWMSVEAALRYRSVSALPANIASASSLCLTYPSDAYISSRRRWDSACVNRRSAGS